MKPQTNFMEARGFEPLTSGLQSPRSAKLSYAPKRKRLVAGAGFEPATFGLCLPLRLSPPTNGLWSGLSLHPRLHVRMPAIKSLHLLRFQSLARDHPASGFPEFDR